MKKLIIALVIILILVIGGGLFAKQKGLIGNEEFTKVAVQLAENKEIIGTVSATGKIYPEAEINISPDVPGEIIELNVEEGDSVVTGQILLKIRPDDYRTAIDRSISGLNSSKAQKSNAEARLDQTNSQLINAKAELDRSKRLFQEQLIPQQDLARAELAYQSALADKEAALQSVKSAEFSIDISSTDVRQARDSFQKTVVRAPQSGIVSKLNVEKGERVVGTSQMAGTEMLTIANLKNMEVRVEVSEINIARVEIGDTCDIEVDAYYDKTFRGVVTKISNSLGSSLANQTSTDQVTNFLVTVNIFPESYADLQDKKFPFRPGMSASVDIITEQENEKIGIPLQAVTVKTEKEYKQFINDSTANEADDKELKEYVFVVNNGKSNLVPVKSGFQDSKGTIVIESGLNKGDSVVIAPFSAINKQLKFDEQLQIVDEGSVYSSDK